MKVGLSSPGTRSDQAGRRLGRGSRILAVVAAIVGAGLIALVALPVLSPGLGASTADVLRGIVGPDPVAALESVSLQVGDAFNQVKYRVTGGQAQIDWTSPKVQPSLPSISATPPAMQPSLPHQLSTGGAVASRPAAPAMPVVPNPPSKIAAEPKPAASSGVVDASPALGWEAFALAPSQRPILARASVKPDPARPYAQVALVRIDLSQARLHLVAGTVEPKAAPQVAPFARPGAIPAEDQVPGHLLAAFNGGFKAMHGQYGMMLDGITILPPQDGIATLALYRDGSVRMGAWGRDITPDPEMIAYRQNCPLLVDQGRINPAVNDDNHKAWGLTVKNLDTTWRSGLGITEDGRFLIYAAGPSLTVKSLADALQAAGAYYAMQLDINTFYTRFVTYAPATQVQTRYPVAAQKLLQQMAGTDTQFLAKDDRDFFYVTTGDAPALTVAR